MIKITYTSGLIDTFEIYYESEQHIAYKDNADNLLKINKLTGDTLINIENEWVPHDMGICSFEKIT